MIDLNSMLRDATERIDSHYFLLNIAGAKSVYRERVYCYELYHQLRKKWDRTDFVINGEVDKAGHPLLGCLGVKGRKPDLLIHGPGDMDKNYAILEVKSCEVDRRGIRKDLETLKFFRQHGRYKNAVFLIYGERSNKTAEVVSDIAGKISDFPKIDLWVHEAPLLAARHFGAFGVII